MQGSEVVGGWGTTWMSWRGRRGGAGGGLRGRQWTAVCTWTSWHTPLLPSHTGDLKVKYSKPSPAHWNVKQHCGQFWHFKLETGEVLSTTGDYGHWWRLTERERESGGVWWPDSPEVRWCLYDNTSKLPARSRGSPLSPGVLTPTLHWEAGLAMSRCETEMYIDI